MELVFFFKYQVIVKTLLHVLIPKAFFLCSLSKHFLDIFRSYRFFYRQSYLQNITVKKMLSFKIPIVL